MEKTGFIYSLSDPNTSLVRYIGQTICPIKQRFKKHLSDSKRNKNHVSNWIKFLIDNNFKPIIEVLEECKISELDNKEIYYIKKYKDDGFDLTNCHLGGQRRRFFSQETKDKISNSLKGKVQSEETKLKRSISSKETWKDEGLRKLKSVQSKKLNELAIIGNKGKPSKKKGKPFSGDLKKLSESLKKHYIDNRSKSRTEEELENKIVQDYKTDLSVREISEKYSINRNVITRIAKRNNLILKNGSKKIDKETLQRLVFEKNTANKIANYFKCSIANVEKYKKIHKVYATK